MDTKYLQTLDLPKILERVAEYTSFSAGRELVLALRPTSDLEEARRRQGETREALYLIDSQGGVSLGGVYDVRPLVDGASRGVTLLPGDLLDVRSTLLRGQSLQRTITRQAAQLPLLAAIAARIEPCPHVAAEIGRCINDQAEVVDAASPRLAQIRRDLKIAHDRLLDKFNRLVTSPEAATYLQEAFVTQRNGRYVIPLKADFKGRVPGLVHDTSASGATLFIEPLATVELNNRWRELQIEEEREVQRILAELSGLVAEEGEFITRTVEALAELDLALAKAEYAHATRSVEPELVPFKTRNIKGRKQPPDLHHPGSTIKLLRARHPLLDPAAVVPIDVYLYDDYFVLVITGPNTGGKTVSLKTVGLLTLMAQAGLHIPAAEGSVLSVFEGVYADIGDEQSIELSLSTFSSHMSNIIRVLDGADERSLVLLDELGAGTDPSEGSALARAILSHLVRRRVTTLAATHSSELKVYAHATPGVENASVEFDLETLSPTYELTIGLPGRSNAFAIATRLGLPQEIVEEARGLVTPEGLEAEALLAEIKVAREEALAAREAARAAQREAEGLAEQLRLRLATIEEERRTIVNQAREEARQELESVRAELRQVRARLATALLSAQRPPELAEAEQSLDVLEAQAPPLEEITLPEIGAPAGPLAVGDTVWIAGLGVTGEIEELFDDGAVVQAGGFRVRARREMLELRRHEEPLPTEEPAPPGSAVTTEELPPSPGIELNLRGLRVDEALGRVDQHLNAAFLAGLPFVRIVHGKGTGALRHAVRQTLAGHPLIASFRPGEEGEGGDGVTVAYLGNS